MLNPDYLDMLRAFTEEGVEFVIVGAYALAKHGLVRATGDIDLFVNPTQENSKKVHRALVKFGAPMDGITEISFAQEGIILQIGVIPRRIDIITQIDGVSFQSCFEHRENVPFGDLSVPVISLEDLLINKSATGRTKDAADVEWIKKHSGK